MKAEYIKIFSLLISLFYVNILELNNLRKRNKSSNKNDIEYFRLLDDEYDTSKRNNKDDIDSIEKCQDSDKDYFSYYIKGEKFTFDKYIDEKNSVIYYNL